jgi:hypothetical protein
MSIELMQEIAVKMTESGIPVDLGQLRQAFEATCERRSYGSAYLLEHAHQMMAGYLYGVKDVLYPTWRLLMGEDHIPYSWKSVEPNTLAMPLDMLKAAKGTYIDLYQAENYAQALLLGDQHWIDHYQNGGNLWDLVREAYEASGDMPPDMKEDFFKGTYGTFSKRFSKAFPELAKNVLDFQDRGEVFTLYGSNLNRVKVNRPSAKMRITCVHSIKDAVRIAVLAAYQETGVAPYCIHHDGCIAPPPVAEAYAVQFMKLGFRVGMTQPQATTKPTTRFQLIEADA